MAKNQNDQPEVQAPTERVDAPVTVPTPPAPIQWVMPRQKTLERQGSQTSRGVNHFPKVRGGICNFCGVLDANQPSQYQYKLCPHYRGMQLRCTYCPESKDADDVIYHADLNITEHPDNPDKLVVCCNSYECSKKHEERFKVSA